MTVTPEPADRDLQAEGEVGVVPAIPGGLTTGPALPVAAVPERGEGGDELSEAREGAAGDPDAEGHSSGQGEVGGSDGPVGGTAVR